MGPHGAFEQYAEKGTYNIADEIDRICKCLLRIVLQSRAWPTEGDGSRRFRYKIDQETGVVSNRSQL